MLMFICTIKHWAVYSPKLFLCIDCIYKFGHNDNSSNNFDTFIQSSYFFSTLKKKKRQMKYKIIFNQYAGVRLSRHPTHHCEKYQTFILLLIRVSDSKAPQHHIWVVHSQFFCDSCTATECLYTCITSPWSKSEDLSELSVAFQQFPYTESAKREKIQSVLPHALALPKPTVRKQKVFSESCHILNQRGRRQTFKRKNYVRGRSENRRERNTSFPLLRERFLNTVNMNVWTP